MANHRGDAHAGAGTATVSPTATATGTHSVSGARSASATLSRAGNRCGTGSAILAALALCAASGRARGAVPVPGVLVAGGWGPTGAATTAEIYDPATDSWSSVAPMNDGRAFGAGAAPFILQGSPGALVAGGDGGGPNYMSGVEFYDPATDTWSPRPKMHETRHAFAGAPVAVDGVPGVLVCGGRLNNSSQSLSSVEFHRPTGAPWSSRAPMNQARESHAAVPLNLSGVAGVLAFGGGAFSRPVLASAEFYDPQSDAWTLVAPLQFARGGHAAAPVTINGVPGVLAIGGALENSRTSSVEYFHPSSNAWTYVAPLPAPRLASAAAPVTVSGVAGVLLAGGFGGIGWNALSSAYFYNPQTNTWSQKASMGAPRAGAIAVLLDTVPSPTASGTSSPSASRTATATTSPTASLTRTDLPPSWSVSVTPTHTQTASPSASPTGSATSSPSASVSPTSTRSPIPPPLGCADGCTYTTVTLDPWNAWSCVPGEDHGDMFAVASAAFTDPCPPGSRVSRVWAEIRVAACDVNLSFTTDLNGELLGTESAVPYDCRCTFWEVYVHMSACHAAPAGFPGYVYGGGNTFRFTNFPNFPQALFVESVQVRLCYVMIPPGTPTASATGTAVPPSWSVSATPTPTVSETPLSTSSSTGTGTVSPAATQSATATATPTSADTRSPTGTDTSVATATPTATRSATASSSTSACPTRTRSGTPAVTRTPTPSGSGTGSRTSSGTTTATVSPTSTETATGTPSRTGSRTATRTSSVSACPTATKTSSRTRTTTATATTSSSASATSTSTRSSTRSGTRTATRTRSGTVTATPTTSGSATLTPSRTARPSATAGTGIRIGPNPYDPSLGLLTLTVAYPYDTVVTCDVYTVGAIRVVTLIPTRFLRKGEPASASWNGRNAQGAPVSPGTYLVVVETSRGREVRRVVVPGA